MKTCTTFLSILILVNLCFQQALVAGPVQNHLVPIEEVQNRVAAQSDQRDKDIEEIQRLLDHQLVQQQVGMLVDLQQVRIIVPTLDDETLSRLADESRRANDEFRGGLGTGWIIVIVAAIAVLVALAIANPGESS